MGIVVLIVNIFECGFPTYVLNVFVFSNTSTMFMSINVSFVEKSVSSVTNSASIVLCAFNVSIPLSFDSFVPLSCVLIVLRMVLFPFIVS